MEGNGHQQAPGAAPGGGVDGGPPAGGQAPPLVEPLEDMGTIGAAVANIANDAGPMVSVLENMAAKINTLTSDNICI